MGWHGMGWEGMGWEARGGKRKCKEGRLGKEGFEYTLVRLD
jgi:hypothetical protein